jgi:GH24 family phage-related lysozyme (muramidase)
MTLQIDWPWIAAKEGYKTSAYWPGGVSGVTIGHGIDLGYYSDSEFRSLTASDPALAAKIAGYRDVTGIEAHTLVRLSPLTLTDAECLALEIPKRESLLAGLHAACQRAGLALEDMPAAAQTVLMDLTWNFGEPWYRCPKFWACVCALSWPGCIAELRNFGGQPELVSRRNDEADLLAEGVGGTK